MGWLHDFRYGLRSLRQAPGFALAAIIALGLGIGANTAIFTVVDALLLKPAAVPDTTGLVVAMQRTRGASDQVWISVPDFRDWQRESHAFAALSAYRQWWNPNLTGNGVPEGLTGARVAPDFFSVLRVRPLLGRGFAPGEDVPGHDDVAVLSYPLWQRRFAADPHVLGRAIRLDERSYTVIGVMPRAFDFPVAARIWVPFAPSAGQAADRSDRELQAIGLLRPGVSPSAAQAELETIERRWAERYPNTYRGDDAQVIPLRRAITGDLTYDYNLLLLVAVFFVLLIACANVANLQFARASRRSREAAVRAALGASRWRLVRERLVESLLLAFAAAAASLLLAEWAITLIVEHMPAAVEQYVAGWGDIHLDGRALIYTAGLALVAGVLAGLAPALLASRPDLNRDLKEGGRGGSAGRAQRRSRSALLVVEIALSLTLLAGAGLMARGVRSLIGNADGFSPDGLLTLILNLPAAKYPTPQRQADFFRQVLARTPQVPGAQAIALGSQVPYGDRDYVDAVTVADRPTRPGAEPFGCHIESISDNYFQTLGVRLIAGRDFDAADAAATAQPVAIVSRQFATAYFPGPHPVQAVLGQRIKVGKPDAKSKWRIVVGVAGDVRYNWIYGRPLPAVYRPYRQAPNSGAYLIVRAAGGQNPVALVPALRRQVAAVDPDLPFFEVKSLSTVVSQSVLGLSYVAVMMVVLGLIALALAAVGIYGVMAYTVGERTREIGVRMALGARSSAVLAMVLRRGLVVTGIGLGIGMALALALARLLSSLFYGISAVDPATFIGVLVVLASAALLACYLPARRASRVDPMVALRYE